MTIANDLLEWATIMDIHDEDENNVCHCDICQRFAPALSSEIDNTTKLQNLLQRWLQIAPLLYLDDEKYPGINDDLDCMMAETNEALQ